MNPISLSVWVCVLMFSVHNSTQKSIRRSHNGIPKARRIAHAEGEISFICPQNGCFPHPEFCEKYYNCSSAGSTPEIWQCRVEADFLFDDVYQECDYAHQVHCGTRYRPPGVSPTERPPRTTTTPTTTPTTTATTSLPTTTRTLPVYNCTEHGPNGAYPHPLYCEMYYDCWEGTSTLLTCPNNDLFDVQEEWVGCAPPETVDCGHRLKPPGEFKCPVDGEDGEHYADPWNCAAFFVCTHGLPVHTLCPGGLLFNPFLKICDYPANVDCSDRVFRLI